MKKQNNNTEKYDILTSVGYAMTASEGKAQYDAAAKTILSDKQILAWILKWTVEEFKDFDIPVIVECIDTPHVSDIPVAPGLTNKIIGDSSESAVIGEGLIRYDIRFTASVPDTDTKASVTLIIDVEAQKDYYPGYDLVTRGFFYGGRMLSDQMGRVISGDKDYDRLQKVYSIWITMGSPQKNANTISSYSTEHHLLYGSCDDDARSDLIRVVMIRLPKEGEENKAVNKPSALHRLLSTALSDKMSAAERSSVLNKEFQINTSVSVKEAMNTMCNLSDLVEERGMKKGIEKGLSNALDILDRRAEFPGETAEDTANAIGCSVDDVLKVINRKHRTWKM